MRRRIVIIWLVCVASTLAWSQRVDLTNTHHRVWMLDSTIVDAKTGARKPAHSNMPGMLGMIVIYHPTDPSICFVEYVFRQYQADVLKQAVAAPGADSRVAVFPKHTTKKAEVATATKALGFPDIDFDRQFVLRVP